MTLVDRAAEAITPQVLAAFLHAETPRSQAMAKRLIVRAVAKVILTERATPAMVEAAKATHEGRWLYAGEAGNVIDAANAALLADIGEG